MRAEGPTIAPQARTDFTSTTGMPIPTPTADAARLRETVELLWEFHDIPLATCERVADELVRRGLVALPGAAQENSAP